MNLRGHLLVAGPALIDSNFRRSVVLVGDHGGDGAMGVVLDRPSAVTVADAVAPLAELTAPGELVYLGGPVQREALVVLAEFADRELAASLVFDGVGFLPGDLDDPQALGELPQVRIFAGYAGWAPGQLEAELEEGSWLVFPARVSDVFTRQARVLWREVLRRQGGAYAVLAALPDDPRRN